MRGALSAGAMVLEAFLGRLDDAPRAVVALYRNRFFREIGPMKCATLGNGLYGKNGVDPGVLCRRARFAFFVDFIAQPN
jgi:hypothetical protein